ncbi:hypothetical protein HDU92_001022 [Lobulomyces angularis]|nr:hypothetical protein HDU92_001022 [Lobulomyces angularis]
MNFYYSECLIEEEEEEELFLLQNKLFCFSTHNHFFVKNNQGFQKESESVKKNITENRNGLINEPNKFYLCQAKRNSVKEQVWWSKDFKGNFMDTTDTRENNANFVFDKENLKGSNSVVNHHDESEEDKNSVSKENANCKKKKILLNLEKFNKKENDNGIILNELKKKFFQTKLLKKKKKNKCNQKRSFFKKKQIKIQSVENKSNGIIKEKELKEDFEEVNDIKIFDDSNLIENDPEFLENRKIEELEFCMNLKKNLCKTEEKSYCFFVPSTRSTPPNSEFNSSSDWDDDYECK